MLNTSHSLLAEETDMNNNSSLFDDPSFRCDENLTHGSFEHSVYDTALFDVLKVDADDFAVSELFV